MATTTVVPMTISATLSAESTDSAPTSILTSSATFREPTTTSTSNRFSSSTSTETAAAQSSLSTTPSANRVLSTGQIVGIAVGGVVAAALAFALLTLIFCVRKRRRRKQEDREWPVIDDKDVNEHPLAPRSAYRPSNTFFENATMVGQSQDNSPPQEKRRSFWRKSIKPEEIGVAVSPEIIQQSPIVEQSPASATSHHTTSNLLPEGPRYTLWPAPLRVNHQTGPESEKRNTVETSDENRSQGDKLQAAQAVPSRTENTLPTDPRARMYALERQRSIGRIPLTPVYDNGNPQDWYRPGPRPARDSQIPISRASPEPSGIYSGQLTEPRTSAPSFHRPGPPMPNRASSRYSNTSESTTFEIDDYDYDRDSNDMAMEPSTPDAQRTTFHPRPSLSVLSPVMESPQFPPPPPPPKGMEDPFISPTRRNLDYFGRLPPESQLIPQPKQGLSLPRVAPTRPAIRIIENTPPSQHESPKDRLVADGQSFLVSNGSTPESEISGITCSQPTDPSPPEEPSIPPNATVEVLTTQRPQFLSPFRPQKPSAQVQRPPPVFPAAQVPRRPVAGPATQQRPQQSQNVLSPPTSLLEKRRGPSIQGLRLSPEAANRPRMSRDQGLSSYRKGPESPNPGYAEGDPEMTKSIWESIGRDRYAAATTLASPRHQRQGSQETTGSIEPPTASLGPGTKVTPTRGGRGELYLRVG